jgi:hypothetical protein
MMFSPVSFMVFEETLPTFSAFNGRGKTKEQGPLHPARIPYIKCVHFVTLSPRQVYLTRSLHSVSKYYLHMLHGIGADELMSFTWICLAATTTIVLTELFLFVFYSSFFYVKK